MRISYWSSDVCSSDLLDGSFVVAGVLLFGSPHLAAQALYLRRSDRNVVLEAAHDAPDLILDLRLQLRHLLTHGLPGRVSGVEGSRQLSVLCRELSLLPDRKSTRLNSSH